MSKKNITFMTLGCPNYNSKKTRKPRIKTKKFFSSFSNALEKKSDEEVHNFYRSQQSYIFSVLSSQNLLCYFKVISVIIRYCPFVFSGVRCIRDIVDDRFHNYKNVYIFSLFLTLNFKKMAICISNSQRKIWHVHEIIQNV